jgi:hypothetical protein
LPLATGPGSLLPERGHHLMASAYTPTQRRMLRLLQDGLPHARAELKACLVDDLGNWNNVQVHISRLRKRLRPKGQDILCVVANQKISYRQVRLFRRV